jgi:FkbH-like protein
MDNTLWDGICLEDEEVRLKPGIQDVLTELKQRGIVHSIASKNEERALDFIEKFGLGEFFVYPHVNWDPKEDNIRRIAEKLNIGLDAMALVDDNPYERESVKAVLPGVRTYDSARYRDLPDLPEMQLKYDTPEARARGQMYVEEAARKEEESEYQGRKDGFLRSLNMVTYPHLATADDLKRISELVTRTNQFNSTGIRYSDEEIEEFFRAEEYRFFIASLVDRYGDYGRCAVALVRKEPGAWNIEILLVSCRVAGRGLGTTFLSYLTEEAAKDGCEVLRAKYIRTDRNRQIGLLYKIVGFNKDKDLSDEEASVFAYDLTNGPAPKPEWIKVSLDAQDAKAEG